MLSLASFNTWIGSLLFDLVSQQRIVASYDPDTRTVKSGWLALIQFIPWLKKGFIREVKDVEYSAVIQKSILKRHVMGPSNT